MPKEPYRPLDVIFSHLAFLRDIEEERPECVNCEHITGMPFCNWPGYHDFVEERCCLSCPVYKGDKKNASTEK